MTLTRISDLEAGRPAEGVFAVVRKQRRHNRNGDPFLVLELSDDTGRIEARVWDNADHFDRVVRVGDTVRAIGRASQYRDQLQLDVRRLERTSGDGVPELLIPGANRPLEEIAGELEFLSQEIRLAELGELVHAVWQGEHRDALTRAPATPGDHHAYLGGLVEHTVGMTSIALAAIERHDTVNRDLTIAACLLHDVGRAREIEVGTAFTVNDAGSLYGHVLLGHEMLIAGARSIGLDPAATTWWPQLVHAIQHHHGPLDRCRTREAQVVASANALDSRLAAR